MRLLSRLRTAWRDTVIGGRFLRDLPGYLRVPPAGAAATAAEIGRRLARRAADLEALVARCVFGRPRGLYAQLFRAAGCEAGDFHALLEREGVEGALAALHRQGVYLTTDEFKGRRPVHRGSVTLEGGADAVRNPAARFHVPLRSSGSRGAGTPVLIDLAFVRDSAAATAAVINARGLAAADCATWEVPGGGALFRLLELAACNGPPARWFSHLPLASAQLHPRYRWSAVALRWGGRISRVALPSPQHVPLEDASPIVAWMEGCLRGGRTPLLFSFASSALRVADAAAARGVDLAGAWLIIGGEPATAPRLEALRRQRLRVIVRYGAIETGALGWGCTAAQEPDEMHFVSDMHALVQAAPGESQVPAGALLVTTLRASAPFVLINASLGDRAVLTERRCGCPLERLGWTQHLHTVRSFEKLTAGGMNFLDRDVVGILEEVLPRRFGGGPADYQLVESESAAGQPVLTLRVHPRVGDVDLREVKEAFLETLGRGSGVERVTALLWRQADLLRVERAPPHATRSGKVLHLHREIR